MFNSTFNGTLIMKRYFSNGIRVFAIVTFFTLMANRELSPVEAQSVDPEKTVTLLPEGAISEEMLNRTIVDERVRRFVVPKAILWKSEHGVHGEQGLLQKGHGQTSTAEMAQGPLLEYKKDATPGAILFDFGVQIHGGIRLESRDLSPVKSSVGKTVRLRVRFGESADEAMAEMDEKGSMNDHSIRDMIVSVPWLGSVEFGESSFRFVRLDLVDEGSVIRFDSVRAVFTYRDLPWIGSFKCSDEKLNTIWKTAAHTQHLTMQGYVIEGAKRDRLVWYGDIHPQMMTTLRVFGAPPVLRDTLGSYARETWPLPKWMNGMPNYSLWWLISVSDYYRHTGDLKELNAQHEYIKKLTEQFIPHVAENGFASFPNPFLDWPTNDNRPALDAGTHAMFAIGFDRIAEIGAVLGDKDLEEKGKKYAAKVRTYKPDHVNNKQAAALLALAGIENAAKPNIPVVAKDGGKGFSTFYGYYMLEALALGEEAQKQLALDVIRDYWGAMVEAGATTFWEDFDLAWLEGSGRIDTITPEGLKSLHGDHGAYCYIGFRHSLCHGWASGPAAWMSSHVLGVQPVEPGFKTFRVQPFLGDLDWAEGSVPTPYGPIRVRCVKEKSTIKTEVLEAPKECKLIVE